MLDPKETLLIANPAAAGGRVGKRWGELSAQLEEILGPVETALTNHQGHATELAEQAVRGGKTTVLALGGDGTNSEVAAGILAAEPEPGAITLGVVPSGTGGDFKRLLQGGGDVLEHARKLASSGPAELIDMGRARFTDDSGPQRERVFLNLASFGMSGLVCALVNQSSKKLGGRATFFLSTLRALTSYKPARVALTVDGEDVGTFDITTIAVANGQYAGGGMHFAPDARLGDGLFTVRVIQHAAPHRSLGLTPKLYNGKLAESPLVASFEGKKVTARAENDNRAWIELDGEPVGTLPAEFEVIPGAIRLLAPLPGVV